jgi:hypothetical protein
MHAHQACSQATHVCASIIIIIIIIIISIVVVFVACSS